jgi:hypothetical protein
LVINQGWDGVGYCQSRSRKTLISQVRICMGVKQE